MRKKWKLGLMSTLLACTTFTSVAFAAEKPVDQPKWEEWLHEHAKRLHEPTSQTTKDLSFLKEAVKDKRIVVLGESTHGAKEINQSKIRMIKYLHEEMGYDVIAFESGLAEASAVQQNFDRLTATEAMKQSLEGVWQTEEIEQLFIYMKEQKEKGTPLTLAGFDINLFYHSPFYPYAKEWLQKLSPEVASEFDTAVTELIRLDKYYYNLEGTYPYDQYKRDIQPVINKFEGVRTFIQNHKAELTQVAPHPTYDVNFLEKSISIRIDAIKTHLDADMKAKGGILSPTLTDYSFYIRDQKMAQNLAWLTEMQHKNKKIIVWGHNYHIRKQNSKMLLDFMKVQQYNYVAPNMMDYLPQRIKNQMYTIGVFAYSGSSWNSNNKDIIIVHNEHEEQSVEKIISTVGSPNVFVNLKGESKRPETSWMFTPTASSYWGDKEREEIMVPTEQYDGILWLEKTTPSLLK
ncbi:erythromycin esterase family protein [Bacillus wiedmannii]|uniref:erythromycin esterase family protein n=1 Tax=Bacillus wiedmannii TaxID=1890302 RepID=UPI002E1DBE56|nr:erythromycin esterase family protein [Bacillus wiedmannii]